MTNQTFYEQAFAHAIQAGCDACEVFFAASDSFEADAQNGEIDRYSVSRTAGVSVRVSYGGKDGYAYTERIEEPERLVMRALDNARCIEKTDVHPMQAFCEYQAVQAQENPLLKLGNEERIALVKRLESLTLAADARVKRTIHCCVTCSSGAIEICNTRGLRASRKTSFGCVYVIPSVKEGEEVRTGFAYRMGRDALDVAGCASEAVADALGKLGALPVPSGTYPVVLYNAAVADLLTAFSRMFSAKEAQRGCSLLADKVGARIASEAVTLWDDPFNAVSPRAFDGEGVPCRRKAIIEKGVLNTLLHNLQTAAKAGCESTGNAGRPSAASRIGVSPTILVLQEGKSSLDELLARMGDGLLITDLDGLHAGVDYISGDFSLKATGVRIRAGKRAEPVTQITIAGNFVSLLNGVVAVGSDLRFALPGAFHVGAPSLLLDGMQVAGS